MRLARHVVIVLSLVFGILGLLSLLSLRSIPVYSGPARVATMNGDANCDGMLNIGDPIHILNYLFLGGSPPCAIAQGDESCCAQLTSMIERLTTPGGTSLRAITTPCGAIGRYIDNGDGTVTDSCTGLMWQSNWITADLDLDGSPDRTFTFNQALQMADTNDVAGHEDWRLPKANEAETLLRYLVERPFAFDALPGFTIGFGNQTERYWTGTEFLPPDSTSVFSVTFSPAQPAMMVAGKHERLPVLLVRSGGAETPQ